MGWFFKSKENSTSVGHQDDSEQAKELKLLNELSPEVTSFYKLQTRSNFIFQEQNTNSDLIDFKNFKLDPANSEREFINVNCSEFQSKYLECLQTDKRNLLNCDQLGTNLETCLNFQKELFGLLGLKHTKNVERFQNIVNNADDLSVKWTEKVENINNLNEEVLKDVYDARDKIWHP
ncbi:hypothetical protein WICMUC_003723 [Wickerhamomyces mucosus]|uniref:Uncharacterized protein n=1 Tax=Wickerhamomyces mucosus TaxID=1378264 RepID=A0A9P8TC37_9ASCO|nr:hypothetical protein WICMUC_003723 [Wickerhamomyces mucosus]